MRTVRYSILTLAAIGLAFGFGGSALAFHSGGVAECVGCHSMHNPFPGGDNLLIGGDSSATCLACHQSAGDSGPTSYHISTPYDEAIVDGVSPIQRTPGGDFGWLHKTYTWAGRRGATETEWGYTHGHNIIATQGYDRGGNTVNYNYTQDPINATAPGGGTDAYPSDQLSCASCHDPHGSSRRNFDGTITGPAGGNPISASGSYNNTAAPTATTSVGVYRLLAGPGYETDGVEFLGAPDAVAPSSYNQSEDVNQVKVAYGRDVGSSAGHVSWGEWCGTCHGDMHWGLGVNYVHPTDMPLGSTDAANYNKYVRTGVLTGNVGTSFTSLVPFVYNTAVYDGATGLKSFAGNDSPTYSGPSNNDRVDCLTCHRAHASGWEYAARWNLEYEFLTTADGTYYNNTYGSRGRTAAEVNDSYYDRSAAVFGPSQRQLCNKCHIKD